MAKAASAGVSPAQLWDGLRRDWLIGLEEREKGSGEEGAGWREKVVDYRQQLKSATEDKLTPSPPLILIAESHPANFLAGFLAALIEGWSVALANPRWGTQEWESASRLIAPDLIWGSHIPLQMAGGQKRLVALKTMPEAGPEAGPESCLSNPVILIPTGGSSGQVKFACHSWVSLISSANGFLRRFSPSGDPVSTCCVLPMYHVSGLMQVLRTWVSGGQIAIFPFKRLVSSGLAHNVSDGEQGLTFPNGFISLVPTQLEQLLQANHAAWLRQFQAVFLGGAPPWPTLLTRAANQQIPLCLSYGMTETAAMVTALMPADFLQGQRSSGQPLPHATIQIVKNSQPVPAGETGQIVVRSAAIAQTSHSNPHPLTLSPPHPHAPFYTDDIGHLTTDGHLHVTGRASSKIISGGENIFPAEVEAALRSTGHVKDVCVVGLPHPYWGEAVTAAYVPATPEVSASSLEQALTNPIPTASGPLLSRYKFPKYWVPLAALPRNAQGKLNRQTLLSQLAQKIPLSSPPAQTSAPDDGDSPAESLVLH